MKKIIFIFVMMMAPLLIHAQGIGLGIKGGVNFANVEAKDINSNSITDFHIGAYLNLNLSDKWGITPEILWTGQGSEFDLGELNTKYVSIPVMLRYKPISLISLEAGPQFSFLTNAEADTYGDVKDQLKENDFGLAIGAGIHLPLGINGGIRYVIGFTNFIDAENNDFDTDEAKNKTFQIYVGWTLFGSK